MGTATTMLTELIANRRSMDQKSFTSKPQLADLRERLANLRKSA